MSKVSVVISAYNCAGYTVQTIHSVLRQTCGDHEIIVVDDGSTDDTRAKLAPFVAAGNIRYIYQQNRGASSARNAGIKIARGQYIALLDCDDLYLPAKLEMGINFLEKAPRLGMVYTPLLFIDETGRDLGRDKAPCYAGTIFDKLVLNNFVRNSTAILRRECFDKAGLFDEALFYSADWDMWLRISKHYSIGYTPLPLTKYRRKKYDYLTTETATAKSDMIRAVEKAFGTDMAWPESLRLRARSQVSLCAAMAYLNRMETEKTRSELRESLRLFPCNSKARLVRFLLDNAAPLVRFAYSQKHFFDRLRWK